MKPSANSEFYQLRERARERRDKALEQVRQEYEETMRQIAELEQRIAGRERVGKQPLTAAIESVLPQGEQFDVGDVMRRLESLDPGRVWPIVSVRRHLGKLRELKLIRRVRKHNVNQPAVYIRDDEPESEVDRKALPVLIAELVKTPMRTAEVVHAVEQTGWTTTMPREEFRAYVRQSLRRAGFRERDGKWGK